MESEVKKKFWGRNRKRGRGGSPGKRPGQGGGGIGDLIKKDESTGLLDLVRGRASGVVRKSGRLRRRE